ncbi:MAG: tetraacyldisaccharide 4'-kinase, partial [Caldimonas sp.]
ERDIEVIVFDERGAGNGRLLPAGPLRERVPRALAPRQLVLYNAPAPTTALNGHLARRSIGGIAALGDWWQDATPAEAALDALRGRPVTAVAGLAHPDQFFAMLRDRGLDVAPLPLADHDDFARLPWPASAADVVLTEKDAIKLPPSRRIATRVWVARLDFVLDEAFEHALLALLPPHPESPQMPAPDAHGNATA